MSVVLEMPPATVGGSTNPRKRKKRAPAAGAANDCFKCQERSVQCDRRRPYCSQCLDLGQDCSGYKTQLTWGVGVASRGKLRGLSLPIADTSRNVPDTQRPIKKRRETIVDKPRVNVQSTFSQYNPHQPTQTRTVTHIATRDPLPTNPPLSTQIWDPTFFSEPHSFHELPRHYPQEVYQQQHAPVSFNEPIWPPQSTSYLPSHNMVSSQSMNIPSTSFFSPNTIYASSPDIVSPTQLGFPKLEPLEQCRSYERTYDGISMLLRADQTVQIPNLKIEDDVEEVLRNENDCMNPDDFSMILPQTHLDFSNPLSMATAVGNIGKTSRMQYLINYYAEVISPVIVAFDSPSNPFRTQILRLAERSETLQHAISALAASNLRQRRGVGLLSTGKTAPARRSSFAHVHLANDYAQTNLSTEEQMREETLHKRLAVSQLNQQLAHPVLRKDDSILATLLILCLFHICDSGIAKFQTQFAGVRKLLTLRGDSKKIGNEDSKWMARLFTCFDSLAATVNDREGQITGDFLDMSALCGDWSLENMAGIDAQLFRIISRLGRLNLLKQGKNSESPLEDSAALPPATFDLDSYAMLDGNGWVRHDSGVGFGSEPPSHDSQFWHEWNDIRRELMSWSLDTTLFDSLSRESSYLTVEQRIDLENISQSFRYSALLYTERLANPHLPCSDETIQRWVRQSLSHIKNVISDVYLLWPLFITGTECINGEGRDIIRGRCQDIQKDSGFVNNASCLLLLEKIWQANSPDTSPRSEKASTSPSNHSESSSGSTFVFRDVMIQEAAHTEGDGEYIVI